MKIWDRVVVFRNAAYSLRGSNGRLFILNFAKWGLWLSVVFPEVYCKSIHRFYMKQTDT